MRTLVSVGAALLTILLLSGATLAFPGDGEKAELQTLSLEGTVTSRQVEKKDKDGGVTLVTVYVLESERAKIILPEAKVKPDEEPPYNLADFVGAEVKVAAQGFTKRGKDGGQQVYVKRITSIERVEA